MAWHYANREIDLLGDRPVDLGTRTLNAAYTCVAADCGVTFLLNLVGGFTVTLPANSTSGWFARFIVLTAPTTAYIIAAATADTMAGSILSSSGAAEDTEGAATGDQLNFVANTALAGDNAEFFIAENKVFCLRAVASGAGGITITG